MEGQLVKNKPNGIFKKLPTMVKALCWRNDGGWIIGGAARYLLGEEEGPPRDWDIMIPFSTWPNVAFLIPENATLNSFRGFKFKVDGIEYDVWPGDLSHLVLQAKIDIRALQPFVGRSLLCTTLPT